jgi:TolB protein
MSAPVLRAAIVREALPVVGGGTGQAVWAGILFVSLMAPIELRADPPLPLGWKRITTDGAYKQRPVASPDGKYVYFTRHWDESIGVFRCRLDGADEQRLFESPHPRMDAVPDRGGKRLAFTWDKVTTGQGDMELYLADADGENPQPLFVSEGKLSHEEWASWSPDGEWIVSSSTRDDNPELYLVKTDGTERQRLTSDPAFDVHPAFSPDGKRIAFATNRWGDVEIALYDLETSLVARLTASPGLDDYPAWSPDGRQIAFVSNRDGNRELYVMQADGGRPRNVTRHDGADNFPSWTPSGELVFVSFRDGGCDIYQVAP